MAAGADEERAWDERADAIVRAAQAAGRDGAAKDAAEALFAAAVLAPEAGEEAAVKAAGEKKMSQESEPGESSASKEPGEASTLKEPVEASAPQAEPSAPKAEPSAPKATESTLTPPPVSVQPKRQSLKEMAARASQAGARASNPGAAPSAGRLSSPGAAPSSVAPPARQGATPTPMPRAAEAGKDDSGVINLQVVHASATAQQHADAARAKPAQAGLFEDEKTVESAVAPGQKPDKVASVTVLQPKKSNAGAIGGIAIAVIGIAAAVAIMSRKPLAPPPPPVVQVETKPTVASPPVTPPAATPTTVASTEPAPAASGEPDGKVAEAAKGPSGPLPSGAAAASAATSADARVAVKGPMPTGKAGDLQSEMAKAVGKDGAAKPEAPVAPAPTPEPASGSKSQNIPEQPSQGAVAAAFGAVMGGAKSCVSGADDVSRASVTFSSGGSVTTVSVSGWAAAHGKSGCVQAALKGAKIGAFSKPSFTVSVPIRP
jgi:hypothetical protein